MAAGTLHEQYEGSLAATRQRLARLVVIICWLAGLATMTIAYTVAVLSPIMMSAFVLSAGAAITSLWLRAPTGPAVRHAAAIFLASEAILFSSGLTGSPHIYIAQADGLLLAIVFCAIVASFADWHAVASYGGTIFGLTVVGALANGIEATADASSSGSPVLNLALFFGGIFALALLSEKLRSALIDSDLAKANAAHAASSTEEELRSLEHIPPNLNRIWRQGYAQSIDTGAISYHESDPAFVESALNEARDLAWAARFAATENALAMTIADLEDRAHKLRDENSSLKSMVQAAEASYLATLKEACSHDTPCNGRQSRDVPDIAETAERAGEFSAALGEILERTTTMRQNMEIAALDARVANERVARLADTCQRIGDVLTLIRSVADKTNLLALNATIEAARAGEAGRGFAVVAGEVKELAGQTAKATETIAAQIEALRSETGQSTAALEKIASAIGTLDRDAAAIATGLGENAGRVGEIVARLSTIAASNKEDPGKSLSDTQSQTARRYRTEETSPGEVEAVSLLHVEEAIAALKQTAADLRAALPGITDELTYVTRVG